MNAGGGSTREAVENIVWMDKMPSGAYKVVVNNYAKREASDVGFVIEVECGGKLSHFSYNKAVRDKQDIHVVTLHMKEGRIESSRWVTRRSRRRTSPRRSGGSRPSSTSRSTRHALPQLLGRQRGGQQAHVLRPVRRQERRAHRGIYNEFLHPRLEPHRKVFEVIGDKTKCLPTDGQLSGLGFSSTKKTDILVRVQQGKKQRDCSTFTSGPDQLSRFSMPDVRWHWSSSRPRRLQLREVLLCV